MAEKERLKALQEYRVLDTLPEKEFDDIVELASTVCGTPISLVSLLDTHRQWFKAKTGLTDKETPIEFAFCKHAIRQPHEVMVVRDTYEDERFRNNPLVTGNLSFRFYAGAPLVTPQGHAIGTLCIIDNKPGELTNEQRRVLQILAKKVMERLEFRKNALQQKKELDETGNQLKTLTERLLEAQETAHIGSWDWNTATSEMYWSPEMYRLFGLEEEVGKPITLERWLALIHPDDQQIVRMGTIGRSDHSTPATVEYRVQKKNGEKVWLRGKGVATMDNTGKVIRANGTVQDITKEKNYQNEMIAAVLDSEEKERKRIATELHDSFGQLMGAMSMQLQLISEEHPTINLSRLSKLVDISIKEYRDISHNLYPPDIINKNLQQLIREKVEEMDEASAMHFQLEYQHDQEDPFENLAHKKELYRIFQELTTNSVKHAKATEVSVKVSTTNGFVVLEVMDNGIGFDLSKINNKKRGIGIKNLFERAELLGGQFHFNSSPDKGTRAKLFVKP